MSTEYGSRVDTPAVGTIYGATPLQKMDTTPDYPANICPVVLNTFEPLADDEVYRAVINFFGRHAGAVFLQINSQASGRGRGARLLHVSAPQSCRYCPSLVAADQINFFG